MIESAIEVGGIAGAAAAGLTVISRGVFAPRSRLFCPVISSGNTAAPARVALTFDDGPWPEATEAILSVLEAENTLAAFFVIGAHARRWPDLLRRIDAGGHIIGNHSHEHRHWGAMHHRSYWRRELDMASDAIADAIGKRPLLFRPPLGHKNPFMGIAARERGISIVTWTNRARDGVTTTPQRVLKRVLNRAAPGQIIALHDGVDPHRARDPAATIAAIGPLIQRLRAQGLACDRLDRLISRPAYAVDARAEGGATLA